MKMLSRALLAAAFGLVEGGGFRGLGDFPSRKVHPRHLQVPNATTTFAPTTATAASGFVSGETPIVFPASQSVSPTFAFLVETLTPVYNAQLTVTIQAETETVTLANMCWMQQNVPCFNASYSLMGNNYVATASTYANQSGCVSSAATCSCGAGGKLCSGVVPLQISGTAEAETVAFCVPSSVTTCPTTCGNPCVSLNYDSNGNPLGPGLPNTSGLLALTCGASCTCNPTWENKCTQNGVPMCVPKAYGPCPVDCGANTTCVGIAFNPDGSTKVSSVCYDASSHGGMCPTICDPVTSDLCGSGSWDPAAYCAPKGLCLPPAPTCTASQQLCYGTNASTAYTLEDVGVCVDASKPCPCPVGQQPCMDSNGVSFCSAFGCPLNCGDMTVNQTCTVTSFLPDGSLDPKSLSNQVCAALNVPCPCGNNSISCSYTDAFNLTNVYCQPLNVDGFQTQCPLSCTASQQLCYVVNYDGTGAYTGYSQSCAAATAACPCGKGTQTCFDEVGSPYCLPTVDYVTGQTQSCPVVCNATTQNTCNTPLYDLTGNVVGVNTSCVASNQQCPCPATIQGLPTNAKPCTYMNPEGSNFTDCIPTSWYCPAKCAAGQVLCPIYQVFSQNGSFIQDGIPTPQCASSLSKCNGGLGICGPASANAQPCNINNQSFCYPKNVQCPLECAANQQLCYITNFDVNGLMTSENQKCVSLNATCPCGGNATLPPGGGACMSTSAALVLSPCGTDQTKDLCWVEDFTTNGASSGKSPVCVTRGDPCPCGKNSKTCPDPTDATQNICIPKSARDGSVSCPTPCTPAQELNGFFTCAQTNLDKNGSYVSTSVSCVNGTGACEPGTNQKVCPSGAMVFTGAACQDIYGVVGSNNSALGLAAGSTSEANIVMTLDPSGANITAAFLAIQANNVQANLNNALQIPATVQVDVSFVAVSASGRRLAPGSTTPAKKVQAVVTVKSTGKTKVAPSVVASKAKTMASTGSSSLTKAFSKVGTPNAKAGVSAATSTKTVVTRASAAASPPAKALAVNSTGGSTTRAPSATNTTTLQVQGKGSASAGTRSSPAAVVLLGTIILVSSSKF